MVRDIFFCALFFAFGAAIEPLISTNFLGLVPSMSLCQVALVRSVLWFAYWWWQGITFTSFFCIGKAMQRLNVKALTVWILMHSPA